VLTITGSASTFVALTIKISRISHKEKV